MKAIDIPRMIRETVQSPDFDATLIKALTDVSTKPEGAMLMMIAPMVGDDKYRVSICTAAHFG